MSQAILFQLNAVYDLIKYIHKLYVKYSKDICVASFKSCGFGIDTVNNIIQTNSKGPFLLEIKIVNIRKYNKEKINNMEDIFKYVLLLPVGVITPIGRWIFVNEPYYINNSSSFSAELVKELNLKLVLPSRYDENNLVQNSLFIPKKYIYRTIMEKFDDNKKLDSRYLFYVLAEGDIKKIDNNFSDYFNNDLIGYEMCTYLFEKFIVKLVNSNDFDDKKNYKKNYIQSKKDYFNYITDFFKRRHIHGFDKNAERAIFFYTYINYFDHYDFNLCINL